MADVYTQLISEVESLIKDNNEVHATPDVSFVLEDQYVDILVDEIPAVEGEVADVTTASGMGINRGETNQAVLPSGETVEIELE